jgi:hypothetical protein
MTMQVGAQLPAGATIVRLWDTAPGQGVTGGGGFPVFGLLLDGRIAVQKLDGTIKVYRPAKHIVLSRNPRLGSVVRADRKIETIMKRVKKRVKRHL